MMKCLSCTLPCLLLTIILLSSKAVSGYYIQPDVLFLTEHPQSQYVVVNSSLTLSCGVQLKGLDLSEGGLTVPIVWWTFNNTRISNVFADAVKSTNLSEQHYLHSELTISHMSHSHTGTYHCNIEDGTDKGESIRLSGLCRNNPCLPFITASKPAVITVLESSILEDVVEAEPCSSTPLPCGSLLTGYGLKPVLEWTRNGISLNKYSATDSYGVLANDDLVLYHSITGEFTCNARSDSNTVTLATYNVTETTVGGSSVEDSGMEPLWLVVNPSVPVDKEEFSIHLASSGVCRSNDSLTCVWTRNGSDICTTDGSGSLFDLHLSQYMCYNRAVSLNAPSHLVDNGRYCCELNNGESTSNALCIDIQIAVQTLPLISSPHNGTTFTNATATPSQLMLLCTPSQLYTPQFWVYNGVIVQAWDNLTEVYVNKSSFGVYQCFVGNEFGYSVVTLRLVIAGLTNPPGLPSYEEIPRPHIDHRIAFIISWLPPNYPDQLNASRITYSLSTMPSTNTPDLYAEMFIQYDHYAFLFTYIYDVVSGHQLSELSPALWHKFNNSRCYKLVYFPPRLSANCDSGILNVSWINNPDNVRYYSNPHYSKHGPIPGRYYINITCYLHDNSFIFETGGEFNDEREALFEDGLPLGSECVFRGAATPANGPAICLNPATILYSVGLTCLTTALVEFKNESLVVREGEQFKEICLRTKGYNFFFELVATYEDKNTTEMFEVHVNEPDVDVCVSVDLEDNKLVDKFVQRNISLSLQANDSISISTGPSIYLTILDDDVLRVGFTEVNYVMQAGETDKVCVMAKGELERKVSVNLSVLELTPGTGVGVLDLDDEILTFLENSRVCAVLNASSLVSVNISLSLKLSSDDHAVVFSNDTAFVTVVPVSEISTNTHQSIPVSVIMVSIVLPLTAVIVIVVCVTLTLRQFNKSHSTYDIRFHEKSRECNDYKEMPCGNFYGSVATVYEGLVLPSVESGLEEKDNGIVSAVNQMSLLPETVMEAEEKDEPEPVKEIEPGGEREKESKPEPRVMDLSFTTDDNTQSPYGSVVSSCSHHQYITTDSIVLFTSSVSAATENTNSGSPSGLLSAATQSTAELGNTVTVDSDTQQINDNFQESGITSNNFTLTGSESTASDLNTEPGNTATSMLDNDVSSFIAPPEDSGIDMDDSMAKHD